MQSSLLTLLGLLRLRRSLLLLRQMGCGGGIAFVIATDLHGRLGKADAVLREGLPDHRIGAAPDHRLVTGFGGEGEAELDAVFPNLLDTLHLDRLDDQRAELFVLL